MEQHSPLHNTCEIGPLRKVLLHRPGRELENLMPDYLERLLFDDIPYLKLAQEEHDQFADTLRQCGVEGLYLTDLTAEAVTDEAVRRQFIRDYLCEAGIEHRRTHDLLEEYFASLPVKELVEQMEAGVRKSDLQRFDSSGRRGVSLPGGSHAEPVFHPGPLCRGGRGCDDPPDAHKNAQPGNAVRQVYF